MKSIKRPMLVLLSVLALAAAGCGGGDDDGGDAGDTGGAASDTITITGTDDLKWSQTDVRAAAGEVTVELTCESAVEHDFVIEDLGDETVAECAPGESATGTAELEAGDYTFYCGVPGHREAGMEGTLTVEG